MNPTTSAAEPPPPSLLRQAVQFAKSFWTDAGKQAAGNLAGLIACQVLSLGCQFVNVYVLARFLSDTYGQYLFALAFFPYFYCIGSLAGGAIALRDIRLDPARFEEIASSFLTLAAGTSAMLAAIAFAVIPFLPVSADERLLFAIVAGGAIFPCLGLTSLFDAHHRQGLGASASAVVECFNTALLFALAFSGKLDLRTAAWLLLARWMLATVLQWGLFLRFVRRISFRAAVPTMRRLLLTSVSPILMALIWNANNNLSVILVRLQFGDFETAIYGTALMIATVVLTTNDMVLRIIGPHILGEHGLRPDFHRKLAIFMTGFILTTSVGAFIGAGVLVHAVLPIGYNGLMNPLAWMLAAGGSRACWAVNDWYLLRFNKQHISLMTMFCTAVGTSLFGWLTSAEFGTMGFPIGMFLFFSAAAVFTFLMAKRYRDRTLAAPLI